MKKLKFILFLALVPLFFCLAKTNESTDTSEGAIKIALQAWSFNRFTFEETVQEAAKMGFKYIEMYPGQKIKPGTEDDTHFSMSAENRELIKSILKENGVKLVQYGVINCNSKKEWIQLFEFSKAMGIETINSEPEFEELDMLDSLTQVYKVNLAVHNHANPTRYWDPQIVLDHIKDKGPGIGACVDNGHWMRSGLDPVESLQKLEGHLIAMHIKDMNKFNDLEAHTVPFGTGVLNVELLIAELKRQNFKGILTIENEYNWETPAEDIKVSLKNLKSKL